MVLFVTIEPGHPLQPQSERGPGAGCPSRLVEEYTGKRCGPQHEVVRPAETTQQRYMIIKYTVQWNSQNDVIM